MRQESEVEHEQPEPVYRRDLVKAGRVWRTLAWMVLACAAGTYFGFRAGVGSVESSDPKLEASLESGWGRYTFADMGIQVELPSHPYRIFAFKHPEDEKYYAKRRYYSASDDAVRVAIYETVLRSQPRSIKDHLERIKESFQEAHYSVLTASHEGASFKGHGAEHIAMRLSTATRKYDYEGYVMDDGISERVIAVLVNVEKQELGESERKRIFDSCKF